MERDYYRMNYYWTEGVKICRAYFNGIKNKKTEELKDGLIEIVA